MSDARYPVSALIAMRALAEQVRSGSPRRIHHWLDHIEATEPACADLAHRLRALANGFRFDAMAADIDDALRLVAKDKMDP